MLIGLGNDLVRLDRIDYLYSKHGDRFVNRIYTTNEQKEIFTQKDPVRRLALHFAAKEATAKALGTGLRQGVQMIDIEILRDKFGQPHIDVHGGALRRLNLITQEAHLFLALTDEQDMALATVVILCRAQKPTN